MSSSPVPSAGSSSGGGGNNSDWRGQVPQAARNKQVREIASVLASLEPGASATSKLRLAMQFEDSVFKSADSLEDYQKKLKKRLKKLQKIFVPTQPAGATEKERTIELLRQNHGEAILYVLKHKEKAVAEMKAKHGEEKGQQLEQHLDAAKIWAHDLGLLPDVKPSYTMADDQLARLKTNIERRLDNVRAHVVKLADPDRFFVETLAKAEQECKKEAASKILMTEVKRRYLQYFKTDLDAENTIQTALEHMNKSVPLPTRSQRNDEKAALIQLEKMRSASSALLGFMALENKTSIPNGTLQKLHAVVTEGTGLVVDVLKEHRKRIKEPAVSLQDSWMKPLELAPVTASATTASASNEPSDTNKRRNLGQSICLRSRILLTAGRRTPPILLPEFRRKGARLVQPPPHGQGSHLILDFEQAFQMTIYLVPLLVEVRASPNHDKRTTNNDHAKSKSDKKNYSKSTLSSSLVSELVNPPWKPLHTGLVLDDDGNEKDSNSAKNDPPLTVWNVKGDYETIGFVVQQRLRDASAHATHILRQCWARNVCSKDNPNDFELEILEGQALLDFLHLVRTTYTPNWQDVV